MSDYPKELRQLAKEMTEGDPKTAAMLTAAAKNLEGLSASLADEKRQNEEAQAAESIAQLALEALRDPVKVHANMLRGTIALITMMQCAHVHGEEAVKLYRQQQDAFSYAVAADDALGSLQEMLAKQLICTDDVVICAACGGGGNPNVPHEDDCPVERGLEIIEAVRAKNPGAVVVSSQGSATATVASTVATGTVCGTSLEINSQSQNRYGGFDSRSLAESRCEKEGSIPSERAEDRAGTGLVSGGLAAGKDRHPLNLHNVLHYLRNPWGHSDDALREARLWAANRLEHLEREEARGVGVCPGCGSPECPGKPEPHSAPTSHQVNSPTPEGWALVPLQPTPLMLRAAHFALANHPTRNNEVRAGEVWTDMIGAAPVYGAPTSHAIDSHASDEGHQP